MKKEDIAAAVNNISDKYLIEAIDSMIDPVTLNPDEVINMNTRNHFTLKRVAILAVATCLVLTLGITAYASNTSFASWFKSIFSGSPAQEEIYEQISADNMKPCTSHGTTITPVAAIADNTMCYIRLKIDAPENTLLQLPDNDSESLQLANKTYDMLVNKKSRKIEPGEYMLHWEDSVIGDNSVDVVVIFYGQTGLTHFNDGQMRTVNIHGIWLQDSSKHYSIVLNGDWSFDIVFPTDEPKELSVEGLSVHSMINNNICDNAGETMTLTQMQISPLSLDAAYHFSPTNEDVIPSPKTVYVVMKDGSEVQCANRGGEDHRDWTKSTYAFDGPIDVNDVDYIQFGSQRIPVN